MSLKLKCQPSVSKSRTKSNWRKFELSAWLVTAFSLVMLAATGCGRQLEERDNPESGLTAEEWLESMSYLNENHDLLVAVTNGHLWTKALLSNRSETNAHVAAIYEDVLYDACGSDVAFRGNFVEKPKDKLLKLGSIEIPITVGSARQQPVNVPVKVQRQSVGDLFDAYAEHGAVFCGRVDLVSDILDPVTWLFPKMEVDDAIVVRGGDFDKAQKRLPYLGCQLHGDVIEMPEPYDETPVATRRELLEMAQCAQLAYPGMGLPEGCVPLSASDWSRIAGSADLSPDVYSCNDGYLVMGNGLRGRLFHNRNGQVVISWSGCDLDGLENFGCGIDDLAACIKYIALGDKEKQFAQVTNICRAALNAVDGEVRIVGHSLGGALAALPALTLSKEEAERVRCYSFNGLGVAGFDADGLAPEQRNRAASVIRNVFCTCDPIYTIHRPIRKVTLHLAELLEPVHFGKSYFLDYDAAARCDASEFLAWKTNICAKLREELGVLYFGFINDAVDYALDEFNKMVACHEISELVRQMQLACPPGEPAESEGVDETATLLPCILIGAAVLAIAIVVYFILIANKRKKGKVDPDYE